MILKGNCLDTLKTLPDCSVDSIVTDPPYELGFMGKSWDNSGIAYNQDLWAECLRVLKPGGHLLAFSGSRTYHRMVVAIEDSGFEIRDQIMWLYGSGFPKSLNVSKAIDKQGGENIGWFIDLCLKVATEKGVTKKQLTDLFPSKTGKPTGWLYNKASHSQSLSPQQFNVLRDFLELPYADLAEAKRATVGYKEAGMGSGETFGMRQTEGDNANAERTVAITAPATPEAQQWEGWGTALKPAHEPIVVARKPLIGTVANNVLTHGTGALNIDGSRVPSDDGFEKAWDKPVSTNISAPNGKFITEGSQHTVDLTSNRPVGGRWPANVIHDGSDEVLAGFPNTAPSRKGKPRGTAKKGLFANSEFNKVGTEHNDSGSAARFFYCAKASKSERNAGLEGLPECDIGIYAQDEWSRKNMGNAPKPRQNFHPTVKPLALMRYLVKLVTPPNGTVLDPFLGSGSTAVAAILEGFEWIGCEMTEDYFSIIEARVEWALNQPKPMV